MPADKLLLARLGQDYYALPIAAIEEVLPDLPMESVPQCPAFVRGVIFVRGHLIPVLSAAERLGLPGRQRPEESNIVCMRIGTRLVGVEFDEVLDLIEVDRMTALPSTDISSGQGFFAGMIEREGRLIRLLDPDKLTSTAEQQKWQNIS